jgi:hypothetical protein
MSEQIPGQMTWKPEGATEAGILHLRHHPSEEWRPYTAFPEYIIPNPAKFEFSDGYATFLALLKKQWQLL